MIVREQQDSYIMIEQHHHAQVSGQLAANLKDSFFLEEDFKPSVLYAITNHDFAWKMIDKQPFWNDEKNTPYTFTDFPNPAKTVFYKHGVDEVEKHDRYAALLCSEHYARFLLDDAAEESQLFVQKERERQKRLIQFIDGYEENIFNVHRDLLRLFDSLSLYVCMNNPGVSKQNEHPFFKDGLPVPKSLTFFHTNKIDMHWKDEQSIEMGVFPFSSPVDITIYQKSVPKKAIEEYGLINSYEYTEAETLSVQLL
ncbi:DUF3891 family protein [Lentibacillus amyloliquefaciens]|uniref:Uncharacterized protein n=1 Tax=Lentibacillus amyloliquefaciens TaxID=1472767 RepID=A0A0U4EFH0_9BACI|nr:DUF3891 family protein [Lentibacillus amyloliquefaciens]ALX49305.1 hypothetical protein AOX59_12315 [Lentibacillus amyloliquefaciens]